MVFYFFAGSREKGDFFKSFLNEDFFKGGFLNGIFKEIRRKKKKGNITEFFNSLENMTEEEFKKKFGSSKKEMIKKINKFFKSKKW